MNENTTEITISLEASIPESGGNQEGDAKAWCTVAGGWLALFTTFGYTSSFGVYQDLYTLAGTSSSSNVSWIGSVNFFFLISMALPAGGLLDKGYFKHVVFVGSVIYVFSLFMLSLAHIDRYYQIFLSQGVGMGIGSGLIYLPSVAVQAHHWKARRPLAMGIVITGSSVGGIIYPIMLNNLFNSSVGFAWGVRASAFLTLGLLAVANYLMSAKPQGDTAGRRKPRLRDILTDTPFMLVGAVSGFFLLWGLFFPYFYLQLFTNLHGMPSTFAFYTLTIQNGASIFGRILPILFAAKFGVLNIIIFMTFGTGVLVFALLGITNVGGVAAFAILYGFFSGGVLALVAPVIALFTRDANEIGMRMGVAFFVTSFAYLTGPPIAGALLGNQLHWERPIIFSGTVILAGAFPMFLLGRMLHMRRTRYSTLRYDRHVLHEEVDNDPQVRAKPSRYDHVVRPRLEITTMAAESSPRTIALDRLKRCINRGEAIIAGGVGNGISAKSQEAGGIDIITIYNSGRYRMAGRGSLTGLLPYGDANAIVLDMAREVLTIVKKTPVLAGVCGTDPCRDMRRFLKEVKELGFVGVQNFPTVGLIDGVFRQNLEETGMDYEKEVEMIRIAHAMDLLTAPYVFNVDQAIRMTQAGADVIVAHMGLTTSGMIGAQTAATADDCVRRVQDIRDAAFEVNQDILVMCHGGPIVSPDDARYIIERTKGVHGFFGTSSLERLPAEIAMKEVTQRFKAIRL